MRRLAALTLVLAVGSAAGCSDPIVPVTTPFPGYGPGIGSLVGTVTGPDVEGLSTPIAGVTVIVSTTGPGVAGAIVATRTTDALGRYAVDSLPEGPYAVGVNPPSLYAFNKGNSFVQVLPGGRATADFALTRQGAVGRPSSP